MKKIFAAVLGLGLVFAGGTACAADWDFVGAGYTTASIQDRSLDLVNVEASKSLGKFLFVQGGYEKGLDTDLKAGTASVSVGAHTLIAERADVYGKVSAESVVADRADADKYNYSGEAGVRFAATDKLELRGGAIVTDLKRSSVTDYTWYGTVGAEYKLTESFRVGVDVIGKDHVQAGRVSARFYF